MAQGIEEQGPLAVSLLVCDDMMVDAVTGKETLVGKFDSLFAPSFPALHPRLLVFAELTDGRNECPIDVRFVRCLPEEDELLNSVTVTLVFSDPLVVHPIRVRFQNLIFPEAGEYRFQLYFKGAIVTERRVIAMTPPIAPEA